MAENNETLFFKINLSSNKKAEVSREIYVTGYLGQAESHNCRIFVPLEWQKVNNPLMVNVYRCLETPATPRALLSKTKRGLTLR